MEKIIHMRPVRTFEDCKTYATKRSNATGEYVRTELAKLQMRQPVCDLLCSPYLLNSKNPYDDIYNIISQFSIVAREGWGFFFEAERLRRELAELKGRAVETAEYSVIEN